MSQEIVIMQRRETGDTKVILNILSAVLLVVCAATAVYCVRAGYFTSVDSVREFVAQFGYWGAVVFILIQALQVVVPILPGGISCLAGVLLFGAWKGFLYNYIGICIGSLAAFWIAKSAGRGLLALLFPEKTIRRYEQWTKKKDRFVKLFALAIFLPVAPDDLLCYLAGTTSMTWRQYVPIILLGKPFAIAMYSLGLTVVFQQIFR